MPFDPDAYLAQSSSGAGFDPDAYLGGHGGAPWGAGQMKAAVTDIPHEVGEQYSQAWEGAKKLNPFHDATNESLLEQGKNLAQGAGSAAYLASGIGPAIVGAGRSLYGHTMAEAEHLLSGLAPTVPEEKLKNMPQGIADQIRRQQRDNPAEGYQQHAGEFEEAAGMTMPRGRAVPTPARPTPGPFGVTFSEGQATGDLAKIQAEQEALRTGNTHAKDFAAQQQQQLGIAHDTVARSMDPFDHLIADTPDQGAALAQRSMERTAAMRKTQGDQRFEDFRATPAVIHPSVFQDMGFNIKRDLSQGTNPVIVDDALTPWSARMLKYIDSNVTAPRIQNRASPLNPASPGAYTLNGVDQMRKILTAYRQSAFSSGNYTDARAAQRILNGFMGQIDNAINSGAFHGDPRVVGAWRDALSFWSDYKSSFTQQGRKDGVGRVVEQIIGSGGRAQDIPAKVADHLYGASGVSPSTLNVNVANRVKKVLGDQSPEWMGVKQGLFSRLTETAPGVTDISSKKISDNLNQFLNGKGKTLAAAIYSPQERAMLQAYADMHKKLIVPQAGANWSNSATFLQRSINRASSHVGKIVGAGLGRLLLPGLPWGTSEALGAAASAAPAAIQRARFNRQITRQMPLVAQQFERWQQALAKAQRIRSGATKSNLIVATTSLAHAIGTTPDQLLNPAPTPPPPRVGGIGHQ